MCLAPWPDRVGCSVLCLQVNIQGIGDLLEKWIKASTVLEDHLPEGDPVLAEWKENMQHWVEIMNAIQVVFAPFFKVMFDVNRNFCECLLDSELKQQFRRLSLFPLRIWLVMKPGPWVGRGLQTPLLPSQLMFACFFCCNSCLAFFPFAITSNQRHRA